MRYVDTKITKYHSQLETVQKAYTTILHSLMLTLENISGNCKEINYLNVFNYKFTYSILHRSTRTQAPQLY